MKPEIIPEGEYKAQLVGYNPYHLTEIYEIVEGPFTGRRVPISVVGRPLTRIRVKHETIGHEMLASFAQVVS